jgi:hypothetical protein
VAEQAGFSRPNEYRAVEAVVKSGDAELITAMDAGKISPSAAAKKAKGDKPKKERRPKPGGKKRAAEMVFTTKPPEPKPGDAAIPDLDNSPSDDHGDDDDDDDPRDSATLESLRHLERQAADNGEYEQAQEYAREANELHDELYGPAVQNRDAWEIPVQEHAHAAFEAQPLFDDLIDLLRKADRLWSKIADLPGGHYLTRPGISMNARDRWKHKGLVQAIRDAEDCRPTYTVCPLAHTDPSPGFVHGPDCPLCHGVNWTRPLTKSEAPSPELLARIKEAHGV